MNIEKIKQEIISFINGKIARQYSIICDDTNDLIQYIKNKYDNLDIDILIDYDDVVIHQGTTHYIKPTIANIVIKQKTFTPLSIEEKIKYVRSQNKIYYQALDTNMVAYTECSEFTNKTLSDLFKLNRIFISQEECEKYIDFIDKKLKYLDFIDSINSEDEYSVEKRFYLYYDYVKNVIKCTHNYYVYYGHIEDYIYRQLSKEELLKLKDDVDIVEYLKIRSRGFEKFGGLK
jgi:hypothetical protein